jgi:hypothetical protein
MALSPSLAVCTLLGLFAFFVGSLWWTVAAFKKGAVWGVGCVLFLIPVGFLFAARHWSEARWAVGLTTLGVVLVLPGAFAFIEQWPRLMEMARDLEGELFF